MPAKQPCKFLNRPEGCRFGASCKFSHVFVQAPALNGEPRRPAATRNHNISTTEAEFRNWRFMIPKDGDYPDTLGPRLSKFFQKGAELVDSDPGIRQDVVTRMASVGGLVRIRELAEQDTTSLTDSMKLRRFLSQHIPFFQILTHPDVLSSILLEQPLGDLFSFLYGFNGRRAIQLFSFITQALSTLSEGSLPQASPSVANLFQLSLLALSKVVDINGGAQIHPEISSLVEIFSILLESHVEDHGDASSTKAWAPLLKIQQRLGIGQAIPQLAAKAKTTVKQTSFGIAIDYPGNLSSNGPRHDNDHEEITKIQVLPTWQEVQSLRPEYLPVSDPATWHKDGIQGLLDRHFRLLREDTVGQLRDVIQAELARMQNPDGASSGHRDNRQGLRTYTYNGVSIDDFSVDRKDGFRCRVSFPQPQPLREMTVGKRLEWWSKSRRLQGDALVCLLDKSGLLIFCSVVNDQLKTKAASDGAESSITISEEERTLHSDSKMAFLALNLVDQSNQKINDLLRRCWNTRQMSLVEFPGVLLPAFQPTLEALQQMSMNGDVPFPEFLAPGQAAAGVVDVPPPAYATKPGYCFDLRKITHGGTSLRLPSRGHFDIDGLIQNSSLDDVQVHAVVDSLTRRFALIQGPPGTGKSYTGIALIKVLLDNRKAANLGPIICVCYTNHALDQLLEHLVDAGVPQIIRVGSRSKSEVLQPLMLREVAKMMEGTKAEKRVSWELRTQLEEDEGEINTLINALSNADSWQSIKQYLQQHLPHQHDELFGSGFIDEEGFMQEVQSPKQALHQWLRGEYRLVTGLQERPVSVLESTAMMAMSHGEREKLHRYWIQRLRANAQHNLVHAISEYNDRRKKYQRNRMEMDLRCLQQAHVIGITTSGLARNLDLLRRIRAKAMLCEEAGEVLESHTLTAMLPSVEHAILIGDHEQLRPQTQRYDLGREHPRGEQYSLDVSLFERLVRPNDDAAVQLPYTTLKIQRRMHPYISQLVRDTLYPDLQDAPSTMEYPLVSGMEHRLFWFDHREFEAGSDEFQGVISTSHTNDFEIDMTLGLVSHLIKQGVYHAEDIAVLTPYLGQLHKLRAQLGQMWELILNDRDLDDLDRAGITAEEIPKVNKSSALKALKVATIDNFQGEEAKVVVISLVRSNKMNKCGFLKTSNRINVLLSRAQHGMFIIGNSETAGSVQMWADVLDILRTSGNLSTAFELKCPRHPDKLITVSKPDDFTQFSPEGGCNLKCDQRLRCGHSCINKCHSQLLHDAVLCLEPCPRPIKGCDHSCPCTCGVSCPEKCTVDIFDPTRVLPCGHVATNLPCWQAQDLSTVTCTVKVLRTIPGCNHKVDLPCYVDYRANSYQCSARCNENLTCGHPCRNRCYTCKTREEGVIIGTNHGICQQVCGRDYSTCRHSCSSKCHGDKLCPLCEAPCEIFCSHSKCSKKCHEPCAPCAEQYCASNCPHSHCSLPCAAPCDWLPCSIRCEKLLPCGHQCPSVCGEACPDARFCQVCAADNIKDMQVDYIMMLTYLEVGLNDDPCLFPPCGHIMTMANMDGHMDMAKHYDTTAEGRVVGLKPAPPFSNDELKVCPTCRGPLRSISRYGRIVRRALLDESTKKFIVWSNKVYFGLQSQFQAAQDQLSNTTETVLVGALAPVKLHISGNPTIQFRWLKEAVGALMLHSRYAQIIQVRNSIHAHVKKVRKEEQPFKRVHDFCQDARRRREIAGSFDFDQDVLQTRAHLLAEALLLRCDLTLLTDIVSVWRDKLPPHLRAEALVNLSASRTRCLELLNDASAARSPAQQVEALLAYAQLNAIERPFAAPPTIQDQLREEALTHITNARILCAAHPGSTAGLSDEVDAVERMLRAETFFSVVTSEERRAVLAAMAAEFRGTGHWYYCENGHPFTVGECGMPMQQTACPQCGAPAGGRDHAPAAGVTRADDLEAELGRLRL